MANNIIVSILLIGYTLFTVTYGQLDLYRRVCYFPSWKHARLGPTQFSPDNITDPTLCTHIVIAFAGVDPQSFNIKPLQYDEDGPTGLWRNMTNIKLRSPFTKILLAVGGWDFGVLPFSKLVETDNGIDSFAINAANFLRERNFDGLDIDWEYPGQFGSPAGDKYRFTLLLKVLSQRFKQESVDRGLPRLLLSVAVPVEKEFVDQGFEIQKISRHVDFINLMSYDMYGPWGEVIGHHSALYGKPGDTPYMAPRNVNWVVNYWIDKGMPYDKIVVGVPFYGRTFATINQTTHEPGVSFKSGGIGGPYTQSNGLIGAFELCQVLNDPRYRIEWDYQSQVPFAYSDTDWIGYDDKQSIRTKTNYVVSRKLGGVMIWDISLDDFSGQFCNQGKYPLLTEIKKLLTLNSIARPSRPRRPVYNINPVLTYRDYYRLWLNKFIG